MNTLLFESLESLIFFILCFVLFFVARLSYKLLNRKIDIRNELVEKDNVAFAISQIGYFAGLTVAIGGVLLGPSTDLVSDIINFLTYGAVAIILLNASMYVNDKFILCRFSVYKEIIHDMNAGAGIIHGSSAFAAGLVIMGSIYGEGGGVDTVIIYWLIAQLLLVLTAWIYNLILPYNVHEHIEKDNVAAGVGFAGALIAIANLIRNAVMHDFISWPDSFMEIGYTVGLGLLLLPVVRFLTDKILLPGRKLTDEIVNQEKPNLGAGFFEAFGYIVSSVLISWCF